MITITVYGQKPTENAGVLALDIAQLIRKKRRTLVVEVVDERVEGQRPAYEDTDVLVVIKECIHDQV
jgi:hypothetical protein